MFKILKKSKISKARLGVIETKHGRIETPFFMPDATNGQVRNLSGAELMALDLKCFVANTLHLFLRPGLKLIKRAQGLNNFVNWPRSILTDSGGYQIFSLIHKNKNGVNGKITDQAAIFKSPLNGARLKLTPEQSIRAQFALGADLMVCLDDCPPNNYNEADLKIAARRTISWAKRCWLEYQEKVKSHKSLVRRLVRQNFSVGGSFSERGGEGGKVKNYKRPLLFAVIQGGNNLALREYCAKELIKIGFDGFGFGARHIDEAGNLLTKALELTAKLIPENKLRFGLGIGRPEDIVKSVKMGYDMFDCVIPTREGRHGRLFFQKSNFQFFRPKRIRPGWTIFNKFYKTINITNAKFAKDFTPINSESQIEELRTYTKAYLHYLFKIKDCLGLRLASLNNLEFYLKMLSEIRSLIKNGKF